MELLSELEKKDDKFKDVMDEAKRLDRFYIPTRYPNGLPGGSPFQVFSAGDLAEACEDLKNVFQTARVFLKKHGIS